MNFREFLKSIIGWPSSKYNELSTFLTALTCVGIFFTHPDFRQYLSRLTESAAGDRNIVGTICFFIVGFIAIFGLLFSLYHVFTNRTKTPIEKYCMGAFAISANALAGIEAGIEEINSGVSLLILFPIWNIIVGMIMLYQVRYGKFEVTDENITLLEVSGASTVLLIVFAITNLAFNVSWAITFSICMFYSSSLFFLIVWIINRFKLRILAK